MRYSSRFKDYELIDASSGQRLERWGDVILIRPDPQVIWQGERKNRLWTQSHARYFRSHSGGGRWESYKRVPDVWDVTYSLAGNNKTAPLTFRLKPMGFKHTGLFPEQAVNWDLIAPWIGERRETKVLNLFAYTGGATLAAAAAGAAVTHVDASRGMVGWARDNAAASGLADKPIRWIVDDCMKFVAREIRRGNRYDAIIMDPPSYGRGPGGEVWKLSEQIDGFVGMCAELLSQRPLFFLLNSYTTGLSPSVMGYMLNQTVTKKYGGKVTADEIGLPVTETGLILPSGATAVWRSLFAQTAPGPDNTNKE